MQQTISDTTAIRLYNSIASTAQEQRAQQSSDNEGTNSTAHLTPVPAEVSAGTSLESIRSANEFGNSCRICRCHRSDMQLVRCPCLCKGSVGHVHLPCLKLWILHRRANRCEICNTEFMLPNEKMNIRRRIRNFFSHKCAGSIAKHFIYSFSLIPLAHVILAQVLLCMESINQNHTNQLTVNEVIIASFALLTSSAVFFHFFEFVTTRFLVIRNILRQWWMFGGSSDFEMVDLENDIMELF